MAVVAAVGIAVTLSGAAALSADVRAEGLRSLENDGEYLARIVEDDVQQVIDQVEGFRGLFEASVLVTGEEFATYSELVGFEPSSALVFARRFVDKDGVVTWQVQHVVARGTVGPKLGDELSDDPVQAEVIARAAESGEPTVSGFIAIEGDDEAGDVAVFQTVTADGAIVGIVAALVQLDERLAALADVVIEDGQTWKFEELSSGDLDVSTALEWSRSLEIGGQGFHLSVMSDHVLGAGSERALAVLVIGIVITGLACRLVLTSHRRRGTDRELEWLRRSSADKDRFLAGVGHELRTPLTVVVGMLDLAIDRGPEIDAEERAELLATARISAHDVARIVDDFVAAGRLSADALTVRSTETDLDSLVDKLVKSSYFDPRLEVNVVRGLGVCMGDGLRITQILLNLLNNARHNAERSVEISGLNGEGFVTIEVRNDGPAIPFQLSQRLFEPFEIARPEGQPQPVGLGLSVSRALARRMGGDLSYQLRDGQVVFSLALPAVPADQPTVMTTAA